MGFSGRKSLGGCPTKPWLLVMHTSHRIKTIGARPYILGFLPVRAFGVSTCHCVTSVIWYSGWIGHRTLIPQESPTAIMSPVSTLVFCPVGKSTQWSLFL